MYIEESREEVLLGVTFNKALSWTSHLNALKTELKKRIGILRCMTFQFPTSVMKDMIQPIFTSKLMYGLALAASSQGPLFENGLLKQLSSFHRQAMKVSLRLTKRQGVAYSDLLNCTGQKSIYQLVLEQLGNVTCKCLSAQDHPLVTNRLDKHLGMKSTRQSTRKWPPQATKTSIVAKMVDLWELMPSEICQEQDCIKLKKLIQMWSASNFCDT